MNLPDQSAIKYIEKGMSQTLFFDIPFPWAVQDSNQRPHACEACALNQLS